MTDELIALRNSRKSIDVFDTNFITNFAENCLIMHSHLDERTALKTFVKVAYRQYFVFLVSCWETYFRGVFVYIYTRDSTQISNLVQKMRPTKETLNLKDITLPELLCKSFNFQNIEDLELAYSELWGSNFLEYVCNSQTDTCGVNGQITKGFAISSLIPDWRELLIRSFKIRHNVVHDANYRPNFDVTLIQKSEALFLMLPQLVTYFIAKRFKFEQKRLIFISDGKSSVPYIFSIHDVLSDNWEVVEKQ